MKSSVLSSLYDSLRNEIRLCPLALLNEEYLETIACVAVIKSGGTFFQGCNVPGKLWKVSASNGALSATLCDNPKSRIGRQVVQGRPAGAKSPDFTLLLDGGKRFSVELKTRCKFSSSGCNASQTFMNDVSKLGDGVADALVLAADTTLYADLRSERASRRGQKGDKSKRALFASILPSLDDVRTGCCQRQSGWWVSGCCLTTAWGERVLVIIARDEPEWARV